MLPKTRVLIADDHAVVRQGLKAFLSTQPDIDIVGEAVDGIEAVERVRELEPDIVLVDVVMPRLDGIEAIRQIRSLRPSTKVIVLTSFVDDEKVFPAVRAGAAGYLLKDVEPQELIEAIRRVHAGESLLHPTVAAKLVHEFQRREPQTSAVADLTEREVQVLQEIARGRSNKEIALELGVADKTVKTHVSNILQKLRLADRTQAALYAVREHLVDLE